MYILSVHSITWYQLFLGVALWIVVIVSGSMNYHQSRKSSRVMGGFGQLVPQRTVVIRAGQFQSIPAEDLVPGDILRVKGGDKIPADMRIIHCSGMKVCFLCLCALPLTHPPSTIVQLLFLFMSEPFQQLHFVTSSFLHLP